SGELRRATRPGDDDAGCRPSPRHAAVMEIRRTGPGGGPARSGPRRRADGGRQGHRVCGRSTIGAGGMTEPGAQPSPPLSPSPTRRSAGGGRVLLIVIACWLLALAVIIRMAWWTVPSGLADLAVYRTGALAVLHGDALYSISTAQG